MVRYYLQFDKFCCILILENKTNKVNKKIWKGGIKLSIELYNYIEKLKEIESEASNKEINIWDDEGQVYDNEVDRMIENQIEDMSKNN